MPTMSFDRTAALAAIDQISTRLVEMVTATNDRSVRVPATPQWTVAEAFAHVATVAPRYTQGARHEGEWVTAARDLADLNGRQLAALPTLDVGVVGQRLRSALDHLSTTINSFGDKQPVYRFHGG